LCYQFRSEKVNEDYMVSEGEGLKVSAHSGEDHDEQIPLCGLEIAILTGGQV